jgi:hypothetical protein
LASWIVQPHRHDRQMALFVYTNVFMSATEYRIAYMTRYAYT